MQKEDASINKRQKWTAIIIVFIIVIILIARNIEPNKDTNRNENENSPIVTSGKITTNQVNNQIPSNQQNETNVSYNVLDTYYRFGRSKSNSMYVWVASFTIVENTGNTNLFLAKGDFEISSKSGTILERTSVSSAYPIIIAPGEKGVYYCEFRFYHNEFTPESYDFVVSADLDIQKTHVNQIDLETSNITVASMYDTIYVRGNISNKTTQNIDNCYIVTFLYDESDKIIGVVPSTISEIPAGRNMNFEITDVMNFNDVSMEEVKRYEVIALSVDFT